MTAAALVRELQARGVKLWAESENLHCRGVLSERDRAALREHKAAVLRLVTEGGPNWGRLSLRVSDDDWTEMRRLASYLGLPVTVDGRVCTLWGISPYGALVDTGLVVRTVEHRAVTAAGEEVGD